MRKTRIHAATLKPGDRYVLLPEDDEAVEYVAHEVTIVDGLVTIKHDLVGEVHTTTASLTSHVTLLTDEGGACGSQ